MPLPRHGVGEAVPPVRDRPLAAARLLRPPDAGGQSPRPFNTASFHGHIKLFYEFRGSTDIYRLSFCSHISSY
jgi:hypothetical protein